MVSIFKKCQNCSKQLPADSTWRRKFCDDKCRVAYHRTKSAQTLYADAITVISKFSKVSGSERKKAIENLKALETIIKQELYLLGDADERAKREMLGDLQNRRL